MEMCTGFFTGTDVSANNDILRYPAACKSLEREMRLGLLAGPDGNWKESLEKVQIAEDMGVEFIAVGEAWSQSIIPWLSVLATNTKKVRIGSAIHNVFSRTPAALAQEYSMLDELSEGRMVLGLGSSGEFVVEHFHGIPFKKPLTRIREYVEIFDTLISGEALNYEGEIFQMSRGFQLHYNRPRNKIPVYVAAITPKSIHQTGAIADGIYPIHWPRGLFEDLRSSLKEGAATTDTPDKEFTIAPFTKVSILDGTTDDEKWLEARGLIHHYVNRMGVFYWQMLERNGFEAEVGASRDAWAERDREKSILAISDDMVRECQVIGSIEEVRAQLHERSDLGADVQMLYMPPGSPEDFKSWLSDILA
ncbi:MAG: hypothetical protein CL771_01665 [Chloroflexi bacterium]|nr:hypothetical protein [Chloroflexota bacterium]|tara:strand:+ start:212 stop:1300 length:1089 start_codon:yes stop_codon:yes gene_type:complete